MTYSISCDDCGVDFHTYDPRAEGTPIAGVFSACTKHVCKDVGKNDDVLMVFDAWKKSVGTNVRFTKQRRHLIQRRLRDWPVEDLISAVQGWENSEHHSGVNAEGRRYNSIELLLRDAAHIEMFRDLATKKKATPVFGTLDQLRADGKL